MFYTSFSKQIFMTVDFKHVNIFLYQFVQIKGSGFGFFGMVFLISLPPFLIAYLLPRESLLIC